MRTEETKRRPLATIATALFAASLLLAGCDDGTTSNTAETPENEQNAGVVQVAEEQSDASNQQANAIEADTPVESAEPVGPAVAEGPRIVFEKTFHDFGVISDALPVSFDFVFYNEGNEVLKIGNVRSSCGCTAAAPTKTEYLPGEEGSIHVTFKPAGRTGHQAKSVRVESNDPENRIANLRISADILAAVSWEPKVFRFDQVEAGHSKSITGEVRVRGEEFRVTDVEIDGPYATAKIIGTEPIEVSNTPATKTTIEVTIHEDAPLGWMDRRVLVRTNNPEKPSDEVPLWANVLGPIEVQPAKLPLGVVRSGVDFRRELRLVSRAGDLFRLEDWKIDSNIDGFDMKVEQGGEIPEDGVAIMRLIVTGQGPENPGRLEGAIVVSTAMADGGERHTINVPFYCVVRPAK